MPDRRSSKFGSNLSRGQEGRPRPLATRMKTVSTVASVVSKATSARNATLAHKATSAHKAIRERALRLFLGFAGLLLVLTTATGCAKRVTLGATGVDITDGREFEIKFEGERSLRGRLVPGSTVRYVQGDSLFEAEVDEVTDEFIELSQRELLTDLDEWTPLRQSAEDAGKLSERPKLGGALLARDEIESISLITVDRRRTVTETLFWSAAAIAAGFAASAR